MDNTVRHAKIAISWKVDGKRKRDCPKETWRRTIQRERQDLSSSHGLTQPEWPKKEINGEHLLKPDTPQGDTEIEDSVPLCLGRVTWS